MTIDEKTLRTALLSQPVPDEHIAEERTWETVRAAYLGRESMGPERRPRWRLVLVLALVALGVGLGVSPAGSAIGGWIRDTLGRDEAGPVGQETPDPLSLPSAGRVLVAAGQSIWVVHADGERTRLGEYAGASWSPRGVFVAAWGGGELVELDPEEAGFVHWTLARENVGDARWSASGFRLAYRSSGSLRVVVDNGTQDRELAADVASVPVAWRPGREEVLAYTDAEGRVTVVGADSGEVAWRTGSIPDVVGLAWTSDAAELVVLSQRHLRVYEVPRELSDVVRLPPGTVATAIAPSPAGREVAYSTFSRAAGVGSLYVYDGKASRLVFAGSGRLDDPTWSPDGRYLLVGWPAADQWMAVPPAPGGNPIATPELGRRFTLTGDREASFPRILGWCCAPEAG